LVFNFNTQQAMSDLPPTKKSAWDKPVSASERLELMDSLSKTEDQARLRLLAVTSAHIGDWLHALPLQPVA